MRNEENREMSRKKKLDETKRWKEGKDGGYEESRQNKDTRRGLWG